MTAIRLQRYLSQAGVAARRKAEELITGGAVTVNGKVVTELGTKVEPGVDRVTVNGQAVYPQDLFYILFNKPKGCITAVSDPEGRLTVMDFLRNVPVQVAPVGRLDFYSEGVLLLTNDGELSARLQSPSHHVEKTYHVKVRDRVSESDLEALRNGVRLDDGTVTRDALVDRLRGGKSKHEWLVITLTEGKSRQIHRMLEALGHTVLKLQRVAFGGLTYEDLRVGDARELTQAEVNALRELVGLPKNTVSRGKWSSRREDTELARRARARKLELQAPVMDDDDDVPAARPWQKARGARPGAPRPRTGGPRAPARPGAPRPSRGQGAPTQGRAQGSRGQAASRTARGSSKRGQVESRTARGPSERGQGASRTARGPSERGQGRGPRAATSSTRRTTRASTPNRGGTRRSRS